MIVAELLNLNAIEGNALDGHLPTHATLVFFISRVNTQIGEMPGTETRPDLCRLIQPAPSSKNKQHLSKVIGVLEDQLKE